MYEITQKQENGLNYIVLNPSFGIELDECSIGMVRQNQEQIPGIVPFTVIKLDGQTHLEYNITGLQPFLKYYRKGWKSEELVAFLQNVAEAIGSLNAYSLPESQLLLQNDYCYVDNGSGRVKFLLLPFDVEETKSVYQFLMELMNVTLMNLRQANDMWMKINRYLVAQGNALDLNQLGQFLEKQRGNGNRSGDRSGDRSSNRSSNRSGDRSTYPPLDTPPETGIRGVGGQRPVDAGGGQAVPPSGMGGQIVPPGGMGWDSILEFESKENQGKMSIWERLFGKKKKKEELPAGPDGWMSGPGGDIGNGGWPSGDVGNGGWPGGDVGNGGWSGGDGETVEWGEGLGGETEENKFFPYLVRMKTGERIPLPAGVFRIGRESDNTYPIKDNGKISRHHIEIRVDTMNESCILTVGQNKNGTRINGGENLGIGRQVKLSDGDIIQLADEKIEFHMWDEGGAI